MLPVILTLTPGPVSAFLVSPTFLGDVGTRSTPRLLPVCEEDSPPPPAVTCNLFPSSTPSGAVVPFVGPAQRQSCYTRCISSHERPRQPCWVDVFIFSSWMKKYLPTVSLLISDWDSNAGLSDLGSPWAPRRARPWFCPRFPSRLGWLKGLERTTGITLFLGSRPLSNSWSFPIYGE